MSGPRVLIADDEPGHVEVLHFFLQDLPLEVQVAESAAAAIRALSRQRFHAVLCDLVMSGGGGMKVLQYARSQSLATPIIIVTGYGDEESVTECLAAGAFDYLSKPVERFALRAVLHRALLRSGSICEASPAGFPRRPAPQFPDLVGRSLAMLDVFWRIAKVAEADANVCLYGESGTGKELVARAIHSTGPRASQPLIVLDCAAIPEGLMESELFGHKRGAFTSAGSDRVGVFQLADRGTLFLDEVAELPLSLQAKLLRVIQCREFRPVGGASPIKVNVRLITASNQDLRALVQTGQFREDLFYRLEVIPITLPPLRARKEDIPLLVDHFIAQFNRQHRKQLRGVSSRTMAAILRYDWPGNVRELENSIERAAVLAERDILDLTDLTSILRSGAVRVPAPSQPLQPCSLKDAERALILQTLQGVRGNRTRAAELLGISLRGLQYKLREFRPTGYFSAPDPCDGSNCSD